MTDGSDRTIATVFGLLGAVFLVVEGILDLLRGVVYLAIGKGWRALGPFDEAVVLVVVGLVVAVFSVLGHVRSGDRGLVAGVVLVVLAIVGWLGLGLASGVIALLGTIFVLIGGIVFLVSAR